MLKVRETIEVMKRNSFIVEKKMIINKYNKEKPPLMKSSAPSNFSSNLYFKWCRVLNQTNYENKTIIYLEENIHQKALLMLHKEVLFIALNLLTTSMSCYNSKTLLISSNLQLKIQIRKVVIDSNTTVSFTDTAVPTFYPL